MLMADQSSTLEFLLREEIPNHVIYPLLLSLPLPSPMSPRLLKILLLRRVAAYSLSCPQTLDTLELIDQLDRDHSLSPSSSSSLQLAYAAVAVDLTAGVLRRQKDRGIGEFVEAVDRVWRRRVGDLEASEEGRRGLASERLREERRLMEEATVNGVARRLLMMRDTEEEAEAAVRAYLMEVAEEMGPAVLNLAAVAAMVDAVEVGRNEVRMVGEDIDASKVGECQMNEPSYLPLLKVIQGKHQLEPGDNKDQGIVEAPHSDLLAEAAGLPAVGAEDIATVARNIEGASTMDKGQMPSAVNGLDVIPAKAKSSDIGNSKVHDSKMRQNITDQNSTELGHGKENQNIADGNGRDNSNAEGATTLEFNREGTKTVSTTTEVTNTLSGKRRLARASSIMDQEPIATSHKRQNDSIDSSLEEFPNPSEKLHIPPSKRRNVEVTKAPWDGLAGWRKKKFWSVDEEDSLRKAVDKCGAGNWALIKSTYSAIFVDRSQTDLKDKWRNMTRK